MALESVTPGELFTETRQRVEWILPAVAPVGARILLSGAKGLGKTLVATELAVATATGTPFIDTFRPWGANPVVLLTTEPRGKVADRLVGFLTLRQENDAPMLRVLHEALELDLPRDQDRLWQALAELRPRLFIIDPIDAYLTGSPPQALSFRQRLLEFGRQFGVTIVVVGNVDQPHFEVAAGHLRTWAELELTLVEDPERRQVVLTTPARGAADPLIRFVITNLMGKGRYVQLVPWPAEPLPPLEARIYDQLRIGYVPIRKLRALVKARHSEVTAAIAALHKKGLVEPIESFHRVGMYGMRKYRVWKARPVTARTTQDPRVSFEERFGTDSTKEETVAASIPGEPRRVKEGSRRRRRQSRKRRKKSLPGRRGRTSAA